MRFLTTSVMCLTVWLQCAHARRAYLVFRSTSGPSSRRTASFVCSVVWICATTSAKRLSCDALSACRVARIRLEAAVTRLCSMVCLTWLTNPANSQRISLLISRSHRVQALACMSTWRSCPLPPWRQVAGSFFHSRGFVPLACIIIS